jgi:hypothetical protein
MRHFVIGELVPQPVAVSGLPSGMEAMGSQLEPVGGGSAAEGLAPSDRAAIGAKPLPSVASAAETKLDSTALAEREPVR